MTIPEGGRFKREKSRLPQEAAFLALRGLPEQRLHLADGSGRDVGEVNAGADAEVRRVVVVVPDVVAVPAHAGGARC